MIKVKIIYSDINKDTTLMTNSTDDHIVTNKYSTTQ